MFNKFTEVPRIESSKTILGREFGTVNGRTIKKAVIGLAVSTMYMVSVTSHIESPIQPLIHTAFTLRYNYKCCATAGWNLDYLRSSITKRQEPSADFDNDDCAVMVHKDQSAASHNTSYVRLDSVAPNFASCFSSRPRRPNIFIDTRLTSSS